MHPILFSVGDFSVYSYPFVMGAAWALSFHLSQYYLSLRAILDRSFNLFFVGVFLFAWVGSKILFLINSTNNEFLTVASNTNFWLGGGFVFYGGLISAIIFVALYSLIHKQFKFSDAHLLIPALALSHGIGRIGCLLAGCCFGKETTSILSIHLHNASRHPVQAYESIALIGLFIILHKQIMAKLRPSNVIFTYLIGYSLIRFLLEFLRGDKIRGVYALGISSSQWISITIVLTLGIVFFVQKVRAKYDKV